LHQPHILLFQIPALLTILGTRVWHMLPAAGNYCAALAIPSRHQTI